MLIHDENYTAIRLRSHGYGDSITDMRNTEMQIADLRYCERCGGEIGFGCLGGSDCDDNLDLLRDGVSPDYFRNPLS